MCARMSSYWSFFLVGFAGWDQSYIQTRGARFGYWDVALGPSGGSVIWALLGKRALLGYLGGLQSKQTAQTSVQARKGVGFALRTGLEKKSIREKIDCVTKGEVLIEGHL